MPLDAADPPSVLMLCSGFPPVVGGAERQAEKLARSLIDQGCPVRVLTLGDGKTAEAEVQDGLSVTRLPKPSLPALPGIGALNLVLLNRGLQRALRLELSQADLVHGHQASWLTAFGLAAAKRAGKPTICKLGVGTPEINDLVLLRRTGGFGPLLVNLIKKSVDRWIVTTKWGLSGLLQEGIDESRIAIVPNGVDLSASPPSEWPEEYRRFLYLGRVAKTANRDLSTLIRAFDQLCAQRPEHLELAIVGAGDEFESTRTLVASMRRPARILLPGFQESAPWMRWADAFVLPSRMEGMSNALLEAMAHGLPCIANDIGPNRETLDDGRAGLLVPIGDVEALVRAMASLVESPVRARELSRIGRSRAEQRYSIQAIAAEYLTIYRELIEQGAQ